MNLRVTFRGKDADGNPIEETQVWDGESPLVSRNRFSTVTAYVDPEPDPIRETIINTVSDLVAHFAYYDRKEDEELSVHDLQNAVNQGTITIDEIVFIFREKLEAAL